MTTYIETLYFIKEYDFKALLENVTEEYNIVKIHHDGKVLAEILLDCQDNYEQVYGDDYLTPSYREVTSTTIYDVSEVIVYGDEYLTDSEADVVAALIRKKIDELI